MDEPLGSEIRYLILVERRRIRVAESTGGTRDSSHAPGRIVAIRLRPRPTDSRLELLISAIAS